MNYINLSDYLPFLVLFLFISFVLFLLFVFALISIIRIEKHLRSFVDLEYRKYQEGYGEGQVVSVNHS